MRLRAPRPRRADGLALLAGALAALGLPPFHVVVLVPVGFVLLLRLLDRCRGVWGAARAGFLFGFGFHVVGLLWITNAILVRADTFWWLVPFATPLTALALAPFVAVPVALARRAPPGVARVLALAGLWTLGDLARGHVFTGFPWNPLGSVWEFDGRFGDAMIQPAAVVGVGGLTLATVLAACAFGGGRRAVAASLGLLLVWGGAGALRLARPLPRPPGLDVVLVQGNVPETEKLASDPAPIFERYLRLTRLGVAEAGGTRSVVAWPETASPYRVEGDPTALAMIAAAAAPARAAFIGAIRFGADGRPRNSLVVVRPDGTECCVYDKTHLVPFGEYTPAFFAAVLPFQVVPGGGLEPGDGRVTLRVAGVPPVSPIICYEAIFPGAVVRAGDRPGWILNVTNDGWYADSAGPRQHLEAARMRAVEEGLPLARAANTGISAVFDARGHETGRLAYGATGVLVRPLSAALPATFFARHGNLVPLALSLLAISGAFLAARIRLKFWTIQG